jgi:hypothetical protein
MPAPNFDTFSVSKTFVRVDTKSAFYMQRAGTAAVAFRCTQCKHNLQNAGIKPKFHIYNERL